MAQAGLEVKGRIVKIENPKTGIARVVFPNGDVRHYPLHLESSGGLKSLPRPNASVLIELNSDADTGVRSWRMLNPPPNKERSQVRRPLVAIGHGGKPLPARIRYSSSRSLFR
jgi:hypothetical protein